MTLIDKSEALLPCPFCGAEQDDHGDLDHDAYFCKSSSGMLAIGCSRCMCIGAEGRTRARAIAAWNRRAIPARGVGVDAVAVKNAVMGWVWAEDSDVSKRLGPKHTDALIARILAALAPTDAPNLADPVTVHANMLRGTIAKPTVEQIIHLYGVDTLAKALAPVIVREAAPYMTDLMVDPETIPDMEMEYDHRAGDDSDD